MAAKQMELQDVLTIAVSTLIVVVLAHFAVYWVVKTLYPPKPKVIEVPVMAPLPPPAQAFTPPPVIEQHVELPTYATPGAVEAPREERKGPPPAESTSIRGGAGVDAADAGDGR